MGNTSSNGCFSIVMLAFRGVTYLRHPSSSRFVRPTFKLALNAPKSWYCSHISCHALIHTLPETNSSDLKHWDWEMSFLLGAKGLFSGASGRATYYAEVSHSCASSNEFHPCFSQLHYLVMTLRLKMFFPSPPCHNPSDQLPVFKIWSSKMREKTTWRPNYESPIHGEFSPEGWSVCFF